MTQTAARPAAGTRSDTDGNPGSDGNPDSGLHAGPEPAAPRGTGTATGRLTVTVTIATWANTRWDLLVAAVAAVRSQTRPPDALVVVVDHNDEVLARATSQFTAPDTRVLASTGARGVSGSRNTAVAAADTDLVLFLDDDAVPEPDWLTHLVAAFDDDRAVAVAGGWAQAAWATGRPAWWPPDFDWVVGCSYLGQPTEPADVRNPLGCSMAIRRTAFEAVGGFDEDMGRVGAVPVGADETEFCIRLARAEPTARVRWVPAARVSHHVPATRSTLAYFVARCRAEGRSKAALTANAAGTRLGAESDYARGLVTRRVWQELRARRPRRAAALLTGLGATAADYAAGTARLRMARLRSGRDIGNSDHSDPSEHSGNTA